MTRSLMEARRWLKMGVATIPIKARDKAPALDLWKQFQNRLPTSRELDIWFLSGQYNIAVIAGWRDLVIVDFDNVWRYSKWLAHVDNYATNTYRVRTRRGWHYYYFCTDVSCWAGDGVDVKAGGGYVLAPPSVHPSGHVYEARGNPRQIIRIDNIRDVLPEYVMPRPAERKLKARKRDPFADAMRTSQRVGMSASEIKNRISISDIMNLSGSSRRYKKVKCPFHDDRNASFTIYDNDSAYCFGCQWAGDVIDFYGELHGLSTVDAMRALANLI